MLGNFNQAITAAGSTDEERAAALGISVRTLYRYKTGQLPDLRRLLRHPGLLRAILMDAEQQQSPTTMCEMHMMGHASIISTMRYTRRDPEHLGKIHQRIKPQQ